MSEIIISVEDYHQRTKHSLQQYARGPDALDWDTQPDPFRTYNGSERFELPLRAYTLSTRYADLFEPGAIAAAAPSLDNISVLFELSMGLSSWKVYGATRWALRNNPSSGNLHPTESYLVSPGNEELPAGIFHYHVYAHSLEQRFAPDDAAAFAANLKSGGFLVGLSSVHWREAWKYGERAYRYCQHDVGHAIATFHYATAALGWRVHLLQGWSDDQIAGLLGLNRADDFADAEAESPDAILQVITGAAETAQPDAVELCALTTQGTWRGRANRLSPKHYSDWDVIDGVSASCRKPVTEDHEYTPPPMPVLSDCNTDVDAASIIRDRRSAQAFDGQSVLPLSTLYRMLDCLLPRAGVPPFDALPWQPRIHPILFVHRVDGLHPGLFAFPRSENGERLLRENLREHFDWTRPPMCPDWLPLYHLVSANCRNAARTLSCHQTIAADSAFSLGMLAEFSHNVVEAPWKYRQLFWEAGMVGQSLYLEAEAAGISGTGIGCFFDDAVHETLGIGDTVLQSLYHFTVGVALRDTRLASLPPYRHLDDLRQNDDEGDGG